MSNEDGKGSGNNNASNSGVGTDRNQVDPAMWNFITTAERYDGKIDWKVYRMRLEHTLHLIRCNEQTKKEILVAILSPEVFNALYNQLGRPLTEVTYAEVDAALTMLYSVQVHVWMERRKFSMARMADHEGVREFFNRLRDLARNCNWSSSDEHVRDQLVVGLRNNILEKVLNLAPNAALEVTVSACAEAETKVNIKATTMRQDEAFKVSPTFSRLGPRPTWQQAEWQRAKKRRNAGVAVVVDTEQTYVCTRLPCASRAKRLGICQTAAK